MKTRSRRGARGRGAVGALSDVDRKLLGLVCAHRVLSQAQLQRLFSEVPDRTLRYRTRRLHGLGLLGRSRPYRERGSAAWHFWPTRRADALIRGAPVPRRGERAEPGPVFIAHAAAVSELYVALATQPPTGVRVEQFCREPRERFRGVDGAARAIVPDATVWLRDGEGRLLVCHVEVDLGTMSCTRLRAKAKGYAAYAGREAWLERHYWCPALLFATTSEIRARAFLKLLAVELPEPSRYSSGERMVAAACEKATDLSAVVSERCWRSLDGREALGLVECLELARLPYDRRQAEHQARQRAEQQERERLLADPAALRKHLRDRTAAGYLLEERVGQTRARALELLLDGTEPLAECERTTLTALAGRDPLSARVGGEPPSLTAEQALASLAEHYREAQLARVDGLAERYGEGPQLRAARSRLASGELLSSSHAEDLEREARKDQQVRERQRELRGAYLHRREREARRLARQQGLSARLLKGTDAFLDRADELWLRVCPTCGEIAYPESHEQPDAFGQPKPGRACPYCHDRGQLKPFSPKWAGQLGIEWPPGGSA